MAFWLSSISLKSAFRSGSWACDFLGKSKTRSPPTSVANSPFAARCQADLPLSFDQAGVAGDELGVKAIGQPGVESVGANLAVRCVERAFDGDGFGLRKYFGAACGFDVLVDY